VRAGLGAELLMRDRALLLEVGAAAMQ
jgi:hypothetical protein